MTVNFNNLRKQAVFRYDRLVKKLNHHIKKNDYGGTNEITIDTDEIQEDLDDLRQLIMSISSVYEDGNEDFKDLSEDLPDDISWFNPDDDEDEE